MARVWECGGVTEGESTARWAIHEPAFRGLIKRLTHCARCGDPVPAKPHSEPQHYAIKPVMHVLCYDCHNALPE